ncbi:hypothetical protein FHX57_006749 [Paraburkholderia tropica]|uniref:hypothetical protein n=1 Tax=Paraburkholderia tropica TaxID=92647 RepID=UPI00161702A4|nr:hypothetical protein [Paraburkholderia tropica]MBB3004367.1 hypothetical protein [Paraburkholderia tropica]
MPRIAKQDFTLTRDDCRPVYFIANQEIPEEYADHWWAVMHSEETAQETVVEEKRKPGRPAKA